MPVKIAKLVVYMVDTLKLSENLMSEKQELPSSNRVNREWGLKNPDTVASIVYV